MRSNWVEVLVITRPHSSARILPISATLIQKAFALLASLEMAVYEQVVQNANSQTIALMDEMLAKDGSQTWAEINSTFHRQIAEATQMPLLIEFTNRTLDQWQYCFAEVASTRIQIAQ